MEKERTKSVENELNVRKADFNRIVKERDTLNEDLRKLRTENDVLKNHLKNGGKRDFTKN